MTKLNTPVMSLIACVLGGLAAACTAAAPAALTATPLPSRTPFTSPTESPFFTATPASTATPLPSSTPLASPAAPALITTTGGFFALSVADANASAEWYSDKLGLAIVMQPPTTNQTTVIVLEGGGLIVELIQQDEAQPLSALAPAITDKTLVHGIFKAGVIVEDFDGTVAILRERDVTIAFGPFPARAGQRANVIIQDNEGNLIQFFGK